MNLGFLVKLRRPPKMNQDGSKTMRVYCSSYKKSAGSDDIKNNGEPKGEEDSKQEIKNPERDQFISCQGVCTFALTFKLEERQGQWLLYQEYNKQAMSHNHNLDKMTFNSIRDYISKYTLQIKSLTELKDLIYAKFGLDYSLNQIHYFQGQW